MQKGPLIGVQLRTQLSIQRPWAVDSILLDYPLFSSPAAMIFISSLHAVLEKTDLFFFLFTQEQRKLDAHSQNENLVSPPLLI